MPIWGRRMTSALLEVAGLEAWYGDSHVLHGVDLRLEAGKTAALLGRNGAGKTTTLRAILGLVRKRRGSVRLNGVDIVEVPLHGIARLGLGYVPEERGIFASLSVKENLLLPPVVADQATSLQGIYELFPNLASRQDDQGTKLSGGEQQMLAIARVLRTGAHVLLLDEPTEGLAPVIVQRIGAVLRGLKERGMSILLVEQNFRFARRIADSFYLMENGRIVDTFEAGELPAHLPRLQKILGM